MPQRLPNATVWIALFLASAALVAGDLVAADGMLGRNGSLIGRDFLNAWAGGQLVVQGRIDEIYSIEGYFAALPGLTGEDVALHVFSYPPTLLLFLWPLGFIGYAPALLLWIVATGGAFLAAARRHLAEAGMPLWLGAILPASIVNIWTGHHGFVVAALWLAAFAALPRRPIAAGLLFALLTLKPHLGVLIPILLVMRGEWRTIAAAGAGTLGLAAISVALFGIDSWTRYVDVTLAYQTALLGEERGFFLAMMPTPYISFTRLFGDALAARIVHGAFALAALWLLLRSARRGAAWPDLGMMAATATFLTLPYAFNYDMVVVSLSAAIVLQRRIEELSPIGRISTLLVLAAPILVLPANQIGLPILPFALLGFLHAQAKLFDPTREPAIANGRAARAA